MAFQALIVAAVAAAAAAALTRLTITWSWRRAILAIPNERSSHYAPTPKLGGVAIVVPLMVWASWRFGQPFSAVVLGSGAVLAVLGVADDLRDLPPRIRLPIQACAVALALALVPLSAPLELPPLSFRAGWFVAAFDFVLVLWMVNLYNFMDGIDGIAASQCIVYCVGVLAIGTPDAASTELLLVLLGATLGFAWFNRPPARIFLGDSGSAVLGLLVGIGSLAFDADRTLPLIASLILLAGFWFDATWTLCVRIATGQRFFAPHRSHLYQRCAQRFGHGRTTTMFIAFAVGWLMPLSWLCVVAPNWSIAWLAVAVAPLATAAVALRAGMLHAAPER